MVLPAAAAAAGLFQSGHAGNEGRPVARRPRPSRRDGGRRRDGPLSHVGHRRGAAGSDHLPRHTFDVCAGSGVPDLRQQGRGAAADSKRHRLWMAGARRRVAALSVHQLRIRHHPHLLHRRSHLGRHDFRHDPHRGRDRSDAPLCRLVVAGHVPSIPAVRAVHRQARAHAPDRPALHDDGRHFWSGARRVGIIRDHFRGVRQLHGAHRRWTIVHGFRHGVDRAHRRRAGQSVGRQLQPVRHHLGECGRQRDGRWPDLDSAR